MAGSPHRLLFARLWLIMTGLVMAGIGAGCGNGSSTTDAMVVTDAVVVTDTAVVTDAPASLSWVTFAVTGCAGSPGDGPDAGVPDGGVPDAGVPDADVPDGGVPEGETCAGSAPLSLAFTAVAPAAIDTYLWDFGDGGTSDQAHPVHVYAEPGSYDVTLVVAGERGTATALRAGLVQVGPAALGARCTQDSQCGAGRECVCGQAKDCPAGLEPGVCAEACGAGDACSQGVCADLGASAPASPADWQRALCVPDCAANACADGFECHELPAAGGGWVKGCVAAGVLAVMGASCVDAAGNPDHARCASGHCAALGARGVCSAACVAGGCPDSSACAAFAGAAGADLCVVRCADADACTADPWLGCQSPGGAGAWAFTVDEPAFAQGYCAPRSCASATECGVDGTCTAGYCGM